MYARSRVYIKLYEKSLTVTPTVTQVNDRWLLVK